MFDFEWHFILGGDKKEYKMLEAHSAHNHWLTVLAIQSVQPTSGSALAPDGWEKLS